MKLGIINGWKDGHFAAVKAKGLDTVEFCINDKYDSAEVLAEAEEIKARSLKYNIPVASIGRWGMKRIDDNGEAIPEAVMHDKNLINLASIVGCPVYNVGCNYIDELDYFTNCENAVKYFSLLIEYARDKNVKIAVYNCDWCNFVFEERAWSYILGKLPELGLKFDPSHSYNAGRDYLRELRDWGTRVYHVHLKGVLHIANDGYDDVPAGLDDINWKAVMVVLSNCGYKGALSIEPHSRNWRGGKGQWGIDYTINYMRPIIIPDTFDGDYDDPFLP